MYKTLAENKKVLFWVLQTTGWMSFILLNYLQGIAFDKIPAEYLLPSIGYAIGGFAITLLLREVYRKVWDKDPKIITIVLIGAVPIAALLFAGFRSLVYINFYPNPEWNPKSIWHYFSELALPFYIMLAWSALYFGIKYYRMVQKQNEKLLRATSAAHQAQLKMLRYQLNPHFLFNTLNAISTLVLSNDSQLANQMVTRLSAFLRHSLDRDPMQKVSLKKELDALNMYLSIEKIRFSERLRLETDISRQAYRAMVPSLILQPLIENAIKYAIAVSEEGGKITIRGSVEPDQMLCLAVADTGPGLDPERLDDGNGVGLANTKERLAVLYGDSHKFEVHNVRPHGLVVEMCFPFEDNNAN